MSPQSRVPFLSEITTSCLGGDYGGSSCNACSSSHLSVAEIARAAEASYTIHAIRSSASDVETPRDMPTSLGKRGSDFISSTESSSQPEPFLSSYGSAFLSGIFADIAEASEQTGDDEPLGHRDSSFSSFEPFTKKGRTTNSTSVRGQAKSLLQLDSHVEGEINSAASPTVVSPRPNSASLKIHLFNDQVRELQNLAFPSLPGLPVTVSSSSCTTATVGLVVTPRDEETDQDQDSFGWFVATDDDEDEETVPASMFLPHAKPSTLAFQAAAAPKASESVEIEVQQALAADTIDDVLGDLF
ncbi:hypothetical protein HJC23_011870 [Cyclotella cryptica]|uniref:Uncharacterized protein n=1 Tax=Cyclotella cryptica TaxID=29204 RepID=A0ABD3QFL9_9STRA|eukprot:CCRYP_006196-RA/>CCRYP_006196-RA protein AED:0.27 eAED:0.27 QI:0/-1/0/1/-1/1/1/0/299